MEPTTAIRKVTVTHRPGLHARPCLAILNTVRKFRAKVQIRHGHEAANADDILQLLSLGADAGTELTLSATGPDAEAALDALVRLFENDFGFSGT